MTDKIDLESTIFECGDFFDSIVDWLEIEMHTIERMTEKAGAAKRDTIFKKLMDRIDCPSHASAVLMTMTPPELEKARMETLKLMVTNSLKDAGEDRDKALLDGMAELAKATNGQQLLMTAAVGVLNRASGRVFGCKSKAKADSATEEGEEALAPHSEQSEE